MQGSIARYAPRAGDKEMVQELHALLRAARAEGRTRVAVLVGAPGNGAGSVLRHAIAPHFTAADVWITPPDHSPPPKSRNQQRPPALIVLACANLSQLPAWAENLTKAPATVFTIDPLSLAELDEFLQLRLGAPATPSSARTLGEASGYIPAALSFIVTEAKRQGILQFIDGCWQLLSDPQELAITPVVAARLQAAPAELATAALRLALAEALPQQAFNEAEFAAVAKLCASGIAAECGGGWYRLRIPAVAASLRQLAPAQLAAASFSEQLRCADPSTPALIWALETARTLRFHTVDTALKRLLATHDWLSALQLAEAALAAPVSLHTTWHREAADYQTRLHLRAAFAARFLAETELAHAHVADANTKLGHAPASADNHLLAAQLAALSAELLHYSDGDPTAAIDKLLSAAENCPQRVQSAALAELTAHRVSQLCFAGAAREAHELAHSERLLLRRAPAGLRIRAAAHDAIALTQLGMPRKALNMIIAQAAKYTLNPRRDPWAGEEIRSAYVLAALNVNGPANLSALGRNLQGASSETTKPDVVTFGLVQATWWHGSGQLERAHSTARRAFSAAAHLDPSGMQQAVLALLAETTALRGERAATKAYLAEFARVPPRASAVVKGALQANLAVAGFALGESGTLPTLLQAASNYANEAGFGHAAAALYAGVRFNQLEAASALIAIADNLDGELHALKAAHAAAIVAADPLLLWRVCEKLQRAGLRLFAAEAAASLLQLPQAPKRLSRAAETMAREYVQEQEAAAAFAGHPLLQAFAPKETAPVLTRRESEVQQLIDAGLSNEEIADRLYLSVRTVEGHIARLYRKTGAIRRPPHRPVQ